MAEVPPQDLVMRFLPAFQWAIPRWTFLWWSHPGTALTSWWRSPERNTAVGGAPQSQHLYGLAVDAVPRDFDAFMADARRIGLYAVDEGNHVHLQIFPSGYLASRGLL